MIFSITQIADFLSAIDLTKKVKDRKKTYYNLPCSFDIETSSFYEADGITYTNEQQRRHGKKNAEKRAIMYVWQLAIQDNVIIGRTWGEFEAFMQTLHDFLNLEENYLIIYVHNLSYEFQFICRRFEWTDVFADSERKPIKATTENHFIFKCSYRLSGYSLGVLADNLRRHKIKKMVGDLDYDLLRNSATPLTEEETCYCVNDVLIVNAYIEEQAEEFGNIARIPLTQTGKVRRYVRNKCFKNKKYGYMIKKLTLDKTEYVLLKNAFTGGFTHCNAMHTEKVCRDVTSYDFTSSYPTVLIAEKFPLSKGRRVEVKDVETLLNLIGNYSVLVDLRFTGIKSSFLYENIISLSKCRNAENPRINNGRIISADRISITLTDVDFLNVKEFYTWDKLEIGVCYVYRRDYLPREIIETILKLYKDKTELKGVHGKETEYLHNKELLNSMYGMAVTSIVHDSVTFVNEWKTESGDIGAELDNYNTDVNRFLFYPWGVWCTAYARNNLYTAIRECGADYIYADTDSVKIFRAEKHKGYFDRYNEWITRKLESCLNHYGIGTDVLRPKTIKGVEKPLGVWDFDGFYTEFKTLGAKRYINRHGNELSITVCGLSKKAGKEYIAGQDNAFDFFNDGMVVDCEHTGKMTHTYCDREIKGTLTDYMGNEAEYHELSYIHLEKTDYVLSLSQMYVAYYKGVQKLYK